MATPGRIVAFNAHMLRSLIINDDDRFPDELAAFRIAFQSRRFPILITDGILFEYDNEANIFPAVQLQPTLNELLGHGRAIRIQEYLLDRFSVELSGLPQEHIAFILDAVATHATYLITNRSRWLELSEQTDDKYGLRIVTPRRFVELEG